MGTGIIFASIPQTDSMQTRPSTIWRHRRCKWKKTELVEGRTIAFHCFDWVAIPAVLQGRDFSDELRREKQEMKKWTHGQQVSQIYCRWNHLEETCCGLTFPLLRPFTARSQMVTAKTVSGSEYLKFTNQKSIPVPVYHDLKAHTVTGFCLTPIKREKKKNKNGLWDSSSPEAIPSMLRKTMHNWPATEQTRASQSPPVNWFIHWFLIHDCTLRPRRVNKSKLAQRWRQRA